MISIRSGDEYSGTRALTITARNAADTGALDLTGVDLSWVVQHRNADADDFAIYKTLGDGITVTAPASGGIARVELLPADTDDLSGYYEWELQAVDAIGKVTLARGRIEIKSDLYGVDYES